MKILIGALFGAGVVGTIELIIAVLKHDDKQDYSGWHVGYDGWFEYFYCPVCGYKHQLTSSSEELPMTCPECKARLKK